MLGEFLATDVESIECIGAVGAVFEQVLLGLGEFFTAFVLAEAVATASDPGGLDCENEVVVVLTVEERHQALLPCEALVDEKVFLIVAHRVADVDGFNLPAVPFKFVGDDPTEVLLVDGIVRAERGSVVVENHGLVSVLGIVGTEVFDESRDFALELDVEGLYDVEPPLLRLTRHNPVDIRDNIVSLCFLNNCEF